jgi:hypothetical protein
MGHRGGRVLRVGETAEWYADAVLLQTALQDGVAHGPVVLLQHPRHGGSGRYGVDPDAVRAEFQRQHLGHRQQAALGRGVGRVVGSRGGHHVGIHVHDRTGAPCLHHRHAGAHVGNRRAQVDGHDQILVGKVHSVDRRQPQNARSVD